MKEDIKIEAGYFHIGNVRIGTHSIFLKEDKIDLTFHIKDPDAMGSITLGMLRANCTDCKKWVQDFYSIVGCKLIRYRMETPCEHILEAAEFIYNSSR